jgi:hypothetical protein
MWPLLNYWLVLCPILIVALLFTPALVTFLGYQIMRVFVRIEAARTFPREKLHDVMAILNQYGTRSYEHEQEQVQLAILKLSNGSIEGLHRYVPAAKDDFRDVLRWAYYGCPVGRRTTRRASAYPR